MFFETRALRAGALALLALAGAVPVACGGDGDDPVTTDADALVPSKRDYIVSADTICSRSQDALQQEAELQFKIDSNDFTVTPSGEIVFKPGRRPSAAEVERFGRETAIPSLRMQVADLRALTPPTGDAAELAAIYDSADAAIDRLEADPSLFNDEGAVARELNEAKRLGTSLRLLQLWGLLRAMSKWTKDDRALMKADKVLRGVMEERGPIDPATDRRGSRKDAYEALARAIVGQQLSTKAAASIWNKLLSQFDGVAPTPEQLLKRRADQLRKAGLSRSKVEFLKDLAKRVEDGRLDLGRLKKLSDEDVIAALIEVKGIGRWTAEMFLIFHLARPDVTSAGDLGIRRAVQIAYGLDDLPGPEDFERISEEWRPHRTLASLYLWRSLDNTPVEGK